MTGGQPAAAQDSTGITRRIEAHDSRLRSIGSGLWENPALRPFEQQYDYTTVGIGFDTRRENKATVTQAGKGYDRADFAATTYIHHGKATLWGDGGYSTGRRLQPVWNEVADAGLLYPYLTADDIGGNMQEETYRFAGGYAEYDGKCAWGVTVGYTAGHHWRAADPRPRNVTGRLDIAAGLGMRIATGYVLAASGEFMKYKQTSDIDFKSELGRATIYHLTGLGTDYVRFRGNGMTTHYDGNRYGIRLGLVPEDGNGIMAAVSASRTTVETILSDMNKLPLTSLWHNSLEAQLAWRRHGRRMSWAAEAAATIYRRHGSENIFGDAASAVYPQIGSVELYADNAYTLSARGVMEYNPKENTQGLRLAYEPSVEYSHRCQIYLEPPREWFVNSLTVGQRLTASAGLGRRWHGMFTLAWELALPVKSHLVTEEFFGFDADTGNEPLMSAVRSDFAYASSVRRNYSVRTMVSYALDSRHALQLSADIAMGSYAAANKTYEAAISAGVVF